MRISIRGETPSSVAGSRSEAGGRYLPAGELLRARIVDILASGKTVFQFDGFRAVAENPLGGRVGQVWLFEVVPDVNGQNGCSQRRHTSNNATQPTGGSRDCNAALESSKNLRLIPLFVKHAVSESCKTAPAALLRTASPGNAISFTPLPLSNSLAQPVQILTTWLQQVRDAMSWPVSIGAKSDRKRWPLQTEARQPTPSRSMDHLDQTGSKKIEHLGETWNAILSCGFQLDRGRVKLNLYGRSYRNNENASSGFLRAVFLLNLAERGAVRVDITMGNEHIEASILVEDEDTRRRFAEDLSVLTNTLSSFAKRCYCRVDVDPARIRAGCEEENPIPESMRLNIQV